MFCPEGGVSVRPNKWLALGPKSRADLVVAGRHIATIDEFIGDEARGFFRVLKEVYEEHEKGGWAWTLLMMNVGVGAGASQAHLHAQVSSSMEPTRWGPGDYSREALDKDDRWADNEGLVISGGRVRVYVAPAPVRTGEIRIRAEEITEMADELVVVSRALSVAFGEVAYNVFFGFTDEECVARVVPVLGATGSYALGVGVEVMPVGTDKVRRAVKAAYESLKRRD